MVLKQRQTFLTGDIELGKILNDLGTSRMLWWYEHIMKNMSINVPAPQILRRIENGFQQHKAWMKGKGGFIFPCFGYHPRAIMLLLLLVPYVDMLKRRI